MIYMKRHEADRTKLISKVMLKIKSPVNHRAFKDDINYLLFLEAKAAAPATAITAATAAADVLPVDEDVVVESASGAAATTTFTGRSRRPFRL